MNNVKLVRFDQHHITEEQLNQIAELIYLTDEYIYPEAFGSINDRAIDLIKYLIKQETSFFHPKNLYLLIQSDTIAALAVVIDDTANWYDRTLEKVHEDLAVEVNKDRLQNVENLYFKNVVRHHVKGSMTIVNVSTHPDYQRQGLAKRLLIDILNQFPNHDFYLDVLSDNHGAIRLYQKLGFEITQKKPGFSPNGFIEEYQMHYDHKKDT